MQQPRHASPPRPARLTRKIGALTTALALCATGLIAAGSPAFAAPSEPERQTVTLANNARWTVPDNVTSAFIQVAGASGGDTASAQGGAGALLTGNLRVKAGEVYIATVGTRGATSGTAGRGAGSGPGAGGSGVAGTGATAPAGQGAGGGGASSLEYRGIFGDNIMAIAAGGGGAGGGAIALTNGPLACAGGNGGSNQGAGAPGDPACAGAGAGGAAGYRFTESSAGKYAAGPIRAAALSGGGGGGGGGNESGRGGAGGDTKYPRPTAQDGAPGGGGGSGTSASVDRNTLSEQTLSAATPGAPGSVVISFQVTDPTTTTITDIPGTVVSGQPVNLTVRVANNNTSIPAGERRVPRGTATISLNGTAVKAVAVDGTGVVNTTLDGMPRRVAAHEVRVSYVPADSSFAASQSSISRFTVQTADTVTTLTTERARAPIGVDRVLTAQVSAKAPAAGAVGAGKITLMKRVGGSSTQVSTADYSGSPVDFTVPAPSVTDATGTLYYAQFIPANSNTAFRGSIGADLGIIAFKPTSSILLGLDKTHSVVGEPLSLIATVRAEESVPTGEVTFTVNGDFHSVNLVPATDGSAVSTATLAIPAEALADTRVLLFGARYEGTPLISGSTGNAVRYIPGNASATIAATPATVTPVSGDSVDYTVTVAVTEPGVASPNGRVILRDSTGTELGGADLTVTAGTGTATVNTGALRGGTHSIHAEYAGNDRVNAVVGEPADLVVAAAATTVTVLPMQESVRLGATARFTVLVSAGENAPEVNIAGTPFARFSALAGPEPVTGQVQLNVDGVPVGDPVDLNNGIATLATTPSAAGEQEITVDYLGSADSAARTSTPFTLTVDKASSAALISADKSSYFFGDTAVVTVVIPGVGDILPTGNVVFDLAGAQTTVQLLAGQAQYTIALGEDSAPDKAPRSLLLRATYSGDDNFAAAPRVETTVTFSARDTTPTENPTDNPTGNPTDNPTGNPTGTPGDTPSGAPTGTPGDSVTATAQPGAGSITTGTPAPATPVAKDGLAGTGPQGALPLAGLALVLLLGGVLMRARRQAARG